MKAFITFIRRVIGTPLFFIGITLAYIGGKIYVQTRLAEFADYLTGVSNKLKTKQNELDD
jgi:hypothetical protein